MASNGLREMVTNVPLRTKRESSTMLVKPRSVSGLVNSQLMLGMCNVFDDTAFAFGHIILPVLGFRKYRKRMAIILSVHDNRRSVQKLTTTGQ